MMSKEFLKKLGILGVSFGLAASPLAFADMTEEEEPTNPVQEEEEDTTNPAQEQFSDDGVTIEYENEEEQQWEEENEEEEWDDGTGTDEGV